MLQETRCELIAKSSQKFSSTMSDLLSKSGIIALKEGRVVTLAITRRPWCSCSCSSSSSLFQTARIEVNAELLVRVCGNRRSQDVYVISPFFACISADRAPPSSVPSVPSSRSSLPLVPPLTVVQRCTRSTVYKCRRERMSSYRRAPIYQSFPSLLPFDAFKILFRAFFPRLRDVKYRNTHVINQNYTEVEYNKKAPAKIRVDKIYEISLRIYAYPWNLTENSLLRTL